VCALAVTLQQVGEVPKAVLLEIWQKNVPRRLHAAIGVGARSVVDRVFEK
jgi:hypothetical protein